MVHHRDRKDVSCYPSFLVYTYESRIVKFASSMSSCALKPRFHMGPDGGTRQNEPIKWFAAIDLSREGFAKVISLVDGIANNRSWTLKWLIGRQKLDDTALAFKDMVISLEHGQARWAEVFNTRMLENVNSFVTQQGQPPVDPRIIGNARDDVFETMGKDMKLIDEPAWTATGQR